MAEQTEGAAQPAPSNRLTEEHIELIARHAADGARMQARHQNERAELADRQRAELERAGVVVSGNAALAGNQARR